jgi:GNAT superfamily N-acetyltransferase
MDIPRLADPAEIEHLSRLWHAGWTEAHAHLMPPQFARLRTPERLAERLRAHHENLRVAGPVGAPAGFSIVKGDELYQLYVAANARGSGVAATLICDAESRLLATGVGTAWLACAIGNDRAARFYEKNGWRRAGTMISLLDTPDGPFPYEVWRYEKRLRAAGAMEHTA